MTSICQLSTVHPARDNRVYYKISRSLSSEGYDVTLLARQISDVKDPEDSKVKLIEVPSASNRVSRLILPQFFALKHILRGQYQVIHFHDPELLMFGFLMKLLGKTVIYDVHEDVPLSILDKKYLPAMIRRPLALTVSILESLGGRIFDHICAATPAIGAKFPSHKTTVIQNFPYRDEWGASPKAWAERENIIFYVGVLSVARGLMEMIEAVEGLPDSYNARLLIAGQISPPELDLEVRQRPLKKVEFLGWQDRTAVKELLLRSKVGLVLFHPIGNHIQSQPNKLFEYLAAGVPIVMSNFELWKNFLSQAPAGIAVDPLSPKEIQNAIMQILDSAEQSEEMSKIGRSFIEDVANWEVEAQKLYQVYSSLLKDQSNAR